MCKVSNLLAAPSFFIKNLHVQFKSVVCRNEKAVNLEIIKVTEQHKAAKTQHARIQNASEKIAGLCR